MEKIKIKISEKAHDELYTLIADTDYTYVRLKYLGSCCSGAKVDIVFDNDNDKSENIDTMNIDVIDKLNFIYDESIKNNINAITIIYKNNEFLTKVEGKETAKKDCKLGCTSCSKKCNSPHS
ncbi:MAG TPA: hypothetical protein VIK72_06045 [Clostridiaceae bacterium]